MCGICREAETLYDLKHWRCLQVVAIKGEPFLSGLHPSSVSLSKMFAQQNLRLLEVLSPRSELVKCTGLHGFQQ